MDPVVHFELPHTDRERAERFYATVFGWKTQFLGQDMGDYVLVTTAEADAKSGSPAGAINGGLFPKRPDGPGQHPSVVIGVKDIGRTMTLCREAGGEILGNPQPIPGVGSYVSFIDPEGNRVSMLQPEETS